MSAVSNKSCKQETADGNEIQLAKLNITNIPKVISNFAHHIM